MATRVPVAAPRTGIRGGHAIANSSVSPSHQQGPNQYGNQSYHHDNQPQYANMVHSSSAGHLEQPVNSLPLPPKGVKVQEEHVYELPDFGQSNPAATVGRSMSTPNDAPSGPSHAPSGPNVINSTPNPAYSSASGGVTQVDQMQQEIHLLRMNVNDKEAQIGKLTRDLDYSHEHMKQLNVLLAEKKEEVLKYQERISDMQTDMATLREQSGRMQQPVPATSQAEEALQVQVSQLTRQLAELRQQTNDLSRQNDQFRHQTHDLSRQNDQLRQQVRNPSPFRAGASEGQDVTQSLRQQVDQLRAERAAMQQETGSLKASMGVLTHQVETYNEDFLSERKDRERAQSHIQTLKEENDSLKQAISVLARDHGIRLDAYGLGGGGGGGAVVNQQNQF